MGLGLDGNEALSSSVEIEGWIFSTMYLLVILIRARKWLSLLLFSDINDCNLIPSAQTMVQVTGNKELSCLLLTQDETPCHITPNFTYERDNSNVDRHLVWSYSM